MSDYIKREDAINIKDYLKRFGCFGDYGFVEIEGVLIALNKVPSADVAPVRHGRWIEYGENKDGTHNICCSVCDGFLKSKGHANSCYTRNKYSYCHNCGARMDGERKNDDKSCDTCKHYDKGWDDIICDGCTKAYSNWERRDDE